MSPSSTIRALELFCGIGGFAAAITSHAQIVGAIDLGAHVLQVYAHNFPSHPRRQANLEHLDLDEYRSFEADLFWMSPPCQPYTTRGNKRDLNDRRAQSLIRLLEVISALRPTYLAMENVEGFVGSNAQNLVHQTLQDAGYDFHEEILCPTALGIPARRPRYYLVASRQGLIEPPPLPFAPRTLPDYLEADPGEELFVPEHIFATHGPGMRVIDLQNTPDRIANTFTGAYGKTWQAAGSYLQTPDCRVRRFSPRELLALLDFPADFSFPDHYSPRLTYKAIGNSLSLVALRRILARLPPFQNLALIPPRVETQ